MSWRLALATILYWGMVASWVYLASEIPDCGMSENYEKCLSAKRAKIIEFIVVSALLYGAGLYVRHRYRNC